MKQRVTADRAEPATEDLAPPPRESVCWFSGLMETKLRENDHKGHWRNCDLEYMEQRIREEIAELSAALMQYQVASLSPHEATRTRYLGDRVKREAADVANFAMMIADRVRGELLDLDSAEPEETDPTTADPTDTWPLCTVCGKTARAGRHSTDLGKGHDYSPAEETEAAVSEPAVLNYVIVHTGTCRRLADNWCPCDCGAEQRARDALYRAVDGCSDTRRQP